MLLLPIHRDITHLLIQVCGDDLPSGPDTARERIWQLLQDKLDRCLEVYLTMDVVAALSKLVDSHDKPWLSSLSTVDHWQTLQDFLEIRLMLEE